jgi:hypothetical protein
MPKRDPMLGMSAREKTQYRAKKAQEEAAKRRKFAREQAAKDKEAEAVRAAAPANERSRAQNEGGGMGKPKAKPVAAKPVAAKPKPKPAAAAPAKPKPKPAAPVAAKPKTKPAAKPESKPTSRQYAGKGARRAATTESRRAGYRDGQIVVKEGNKFRYDAATKTFKPVKPTGQGRGRRYNR